MGMASKRFQTSIVQKWVIIKWRVPSFRIRLTGLRWRDFRVLFAFGGICWLIRDTLQDGVFQPADGFRFLLSKAKNFPGRLADGPHLRRVAPAVTAREKVKTDHQPAPPPCPANFVAGDNTRDFLAAQHDSYPLTPFFSRHSRSRLRARYRRTPRLVLVTSKILQISPVESPSISR